jgi:hypothetical protein
MKTVHKVCHMLLKWEAVRSDERPPRECKECPARTNIEGHVGTLMCRLQAQEFVNIVKYGNPWGKKYKYLRRKWPKEDWRDQTK